MFRSLPCDERLRAREVCTAFRAALEEPEFWAELDLRGAARPPCAGLLLAASARAHGALRVLRLDAHDFEHLLTPEEWCESSERTAFITDEALAEVLRCNAASLREVSLVGYLPTRNTRGQNPPRPHPSLGFVGDLLAASPSLTRLDASLECTPVDACGVLLRTNPAFRSEAFRLRELTVNELVGLHCRPHSMDLQVLSGWYTPVPLDPHLASSLGIAASQAGGSQAAAGELAARHVFLAALAHGGMRWATSLTVVLTRCIDLFDELARPVTALPGLRSLHICFDYRKCMLGLMMSGLSNDNLPSFTQLVRESRLREIVLTNAGVDMFEEWGMSHADLDAFVTAVADNSTLEKLWMTGFGGRGTVDPELAERLKQAWTTSGRASTDGFRFEN